MAGLVTALILLSVACGGGDDSGDSTGGEGSPGGSHVVSHAAGRTEVPTEIGRLVALDQPAALNAIALGVEPAVVYAGFQSQPALDEILASYDITPEPLSLASPSFEAVAGARPDLVLGSGHPGTIASYDTYSEIAPTVVVPFAADWRRQLDVTAQALGRGEDADRLVAQVDQRIDELRAAFAERGVAGTTVSVVGSIRDQPFAFPRSGLAGRLLDDLGLARPAAQDVDVAADQGFVLFSPERLTEHDADVLVTVADAAYDTDQVITTSPLYDGLHAVRADRVFRASADMWLGALPFAAVWIVEDLATILLHDDQPDTTNALERWRALVT